MIVHSLFSFVVVFTSRASHSFSIHILRPSQVYSNTFQSMKKHIFNNPFHQSPDFEKQIYSIPLSGVSNLSKSHSSIADQPRTVVDSPQSKPRSPEVSLLQHEGR